MSGQLFFLFCDAITPERLRWVRDCIQCGDRDDPISHGKERAVPCTLYLTGDSLFSLVEPATREIWSELSCNPHLRIVLDGNELKLHGLLEIAASGFPDAIITPGEEKPDPFFGRVVSDLGQQQSGRGSMGFLLCTGPYMSRIPVFALRFLETALAAGFSPELYAYLDGVHVVHSGQRPTEFENIGKGIARLTDLAVQKGRTPWFSACSRCSAARGYYLQNPATGICEASSCISAMTIRNLKEILGRFPSPHPVLSQACGGALPHNADDAPSLVVFITRAPYYSEWTFGGVSLAIAAAMGGISTTVVFIEQGIYSVIGTHQVGSGEKIFNVQEMIEATSDVPDLRFVVHAPSLFSRGIGNDTALPGVMPVGDDDLSGIVRGGSEPNTIRSTRILLF